MSHTFHNQFIHILFATNNFEPLIHDEYKDSLFAYIAKIVKENGGQFLARTGTSNHLHLLINLSTDYPLSNLMNQIKVCSSKWYRLQNHGLNFKWNKGYMAFTVSPSTIENVKKYFVSDEKRHIELSTQDEILRFLDNQKIIYKPEYLHNSTHSRLTYHLVWSVKNREPLLKKSFSK